MNIEIRRIRSLARLIATAAILLFPKGVEAQVIGVQFGADGTTAYTGTGVFGETFTLVPGEPFDTNPTTVADNVKVSIQVQNTGTATAYAQNQTHTGTLYDGAVNSVPNGGYVMFTFSNVAPNTVYNIAGYGARDLSIFATNTSTSTPTDPDSNAPLTPFQIGYNVVLFKATSDNNGNLVVYADGAPNTNSGWADGYSNISAISISPQVMGTAQLLPTDPNSFHFSGDGTNGGYHAILGQTGPAGSSFTSVFQVSATTPSGTPSQVQLYSGTSAPVTAGDALVLQFWYRKVDTQFPTGLPGNPAIQPYESCITAVVDQIPGTGSGTLTSACIPLRGRTQWREVNIPIIASGTGWANFHIECNGANQVVQFGGMSLLDYGQRSVLTPANATNPADATSTFTLNNNNGSWGSLNAYFSTTGQPVPFSMCDQVTVSAAAGYASAQECNLSANLTQPVAAGDTLVAVLWLHRDGSSNPENEGISGYQLTTADIATSVPASYSSLIVGPEPNGAWTQYYIPFTATRAYTEAGASNTAQFQIFFGAAAQTLDVGGIQIIDLGTSVAASSLSCNQTTYPGRSNFNQYWRQQAQANIQTYRMGNLTVNTLGSSGGALSGVSISATETKPAFGWGSWANWGFITGNPGGGQTANPNYQSVFSEYSGSLPSTNWIFNKVSRGEYKWNYWEGQEETWSTNAPAQITGVTDWFLTNGVTNIRGHNLVWPNYFETDSTGYACVPSDVPTKTGTALSSRVLNHIGYEAGCTTNSPDEQACGRITDWDVVNEPYVGRCIQSVLTGGNGLDTHLVTPSVSAPIISTWLNKTAQSDPNPHRFINDDGIELNYARVMPENATNNEEEYDYELFTNVINGGGQVDGIGFEGHYVANTPPADPFVESAIFQRFGALNGSSGQPLQEQMTEYEPNFSGQDMQADYMSDILTLTFSNPNFTAFTLYGFWGGDFTTANNALVPGTSNHYGNIFNSDWSVSPSGEAYLGLVKGQWWTQNATVSSNGSGVSTINGFCGRYAITGSSGGVTKTYYEDMPTPAGATVNLQLAGSQGSHKVWVYDVANCPVYPGFATGTVTGAVNGKAVTAVSTSDFAPPGQASGPAQLKINTEAYGVVYIWFRTKFTGSGNNIVWASIDNTATYEALLPNQTTFLWGQPWGSKTLAAGSAHTINISPGSTGTVIDQVLITDDPNFTPTY